MEPTASWTLAELTSRVAAALSVDYDGQASGRVRDVPDQRAIRWYTTLGLVDRPAAMRGRTALYGPRHLSQLVAIKRLQAGGLSLAAIQAELAGAGEADLERIARVPVAAAERPAAPRPAPARPAPAARTAARFWASPPADQVDPPAPAGAQQAAPVACLQGVRLGDEATLLIGAHRPVDDDDLRALQAAARPLLAALHARGLAGQGSGPGPASPDPGRELT
jgi:DNA-binding transcriptional MerR regulator